MKAEIVLAVATAMEMRAVVKGLGLNVPSPETGGTASVWVRDIPVRLDVCGIGPLAAAYAAGRLAGEGIFSPGRCRGLLSLGIAGTYDPVAAPVGSVVMACREIWPEYGIVTENGVDAEALGFPLAGEKGNASQPPVWNSLPLDPSASLAAMGLRNLAAGGRTANSPCICTGPGITVAGVSGSAARAAELVAKYSGLMENMEGFPLALAAMKAGAAFAEIRAVSNIVGEKSAGAWDIPASLEALAWAVSVLFSA